MPPEPLPTPLTLAGPSSTTMDDLHFAVRSLEICKSFMQPRAHVQCHTRSDLSCHRLQSRLRWMCATLSWLLQPVHITQGGLPVARI